MLVKDVVSLDAFASKIFDQMVTYLSRKLLTLEHLILNFVTPPALFFTLTDLASFLMSRGKNADGRKSRK